jgi:phage anti-repressor protein
MSSNAQVTPVAAVETQLVPVFSATIGGMVMSVCDGRALHSFMEIGKHFASWMTDRIEQYGFQQDQDFLCLSQIRETQRKDGQRGTAKQVDYHLSLDMAKELSMVENNAKGREARRYFIAMERQALAQQSINPTPALPALPDLITPAQAGELSTLIAERFPEGKQRPYAWSRFKNHFRVASYRELPASRFAEACAYIPTMPGATEQAALPAPVIDPALTPISDRLAHGRFLATFENNRLHLREIERDAYVMADHAWPNVIRHEPVTSEVLLDLLDAVAAKLNRRPS